MNRRQALENVGLILGGTIVGATAFLNTGFTTTGSANEGFLDKRQVALLNEIGETIWPETDTPGAKQADVGSFMAIIVRDCYTPAEQTVFLTGIGRIDEESTKSFGRKFTDCTSLQRTELLTRLDREQSAYMKQKKAGEPAHYFRMMKELTLTGYFTSEPGATKFLKYNPAPGKYDGCTSERPW